MLVVIALVLRGVERLVLHFPARSGCAHELKDILFGDVHVGDPAHVASHLFVVVFVSLPVLDHVDLQVWVRAIQW